MIACSHATPSACTDLTSLKIFSTKKDPTPAHFSPVQRWFSQSASRPDHNNRGCSDRLQILSWNPGPAIGSLTLAPWQVTSMGLGPWFVCRKVTDRSLAENFHVITKRHCAVHLNKDT